MGCGGSKKPSSTPPEVFLCAITAKPWGVLGEALDVAVGTPWATKRKAPEPDGQTVIVDPASIKITLDHNYSPADAGGAAGAVYRFLGIDSNSKFPPDVVAGLRCRGDAVYKRYGYPQAIHVIHVIGPDFNAQSTVTSEEATSALAECYAAVLTQFAQQCPKPLLRIPPISSGIYAGKFRDQMAEITAAALHAAVAKIAAESPELLKQIPPHEERRCELCLFEPREASIYAEAIRKTMVEVAAVSVGAEQWAEETETADPLSEPPEAAPQLPEPTAEASEQTTMAYAPPYMSDATRPVDTTGDGMDDTVYIDTTGDGHLNKPVPIEEMEHSTTRSSFAAHV